MPPAMRSGWILLAIFAIGGVALAQRGGGGFYGVRRPRADTFNGSFTFCRMAANAARDGFGGSWGVDYPRADENLSIRLSELTKTHVNMQPDGSPNFVVVEATEPELFECRFWP
ncbi:MAG TPA: hypothetical protein VL243_00020 [Vicinamibacterales bacterium]|nr:hypothetical protein [Vicinamibacterales bacterium]